MSFRSHANRPRHHRAMLSLQPLLSCTPHLRAAASRTVSIVMRETASPAAACGGESPPEDPSCSHRPALTAAPPLMFQQASHKLTHRRTAGLSPASIATAAEEAPAEQVQLAPPVVFQILYQDEHVVAIEKPSGFHVHPPEDGYPIPAEENAMRILKEQLGGTWLYPLHRLDRPTSGVLMFGLSREAASGFGEASRERRINKTYMAMVRGYATPTGMVDQPLDGAESSTVFETLAQAELPYQLGKFDCVRYSLLKVKPLTGHFHQIRRHLNRISRPIVGDTDHGDRAHNRLFANKLACPGMFLKCVEMSMDHPVHGPTHPLVIQSGEWEPRWTRAFDLFGLCPTAYYDIDI